MELSGGEQQRASLARALINRPKLLLADEPTGNLDSRTGTEIMELIRSFNQSLGMTVLMVTHEQALAEKYAGRMMHLADGKLVDDVPNDDKPNISSVEAARAARRNTMKFYDVTDLAVRNLRESVLPQFADHDRDLRRCGVAGRDALARHRPAAAGFTPTAEVRLV